MAIGQQAGLPPQAGVQIHSVASPAVTQHVQHPAATHGHQTAVAQGQQTVASTHRHVQPTGMTHGHVQPTGMTHGHMSGAQMQPGTIPGNPMGMGQFGMNQMGMGAYGMNGMGMPFNPSELDYLPVRMPGGEVFMYGTK